MQAWVLPGVHAAVLPPAALVPPRAPASTEEEPPEPGRVEPPVPPAEVMPEAEQPKNHSNATMQGMPVDSRAGLALKAFISSAPSFRPSSLLAWPALSWSGSPQVAVPTGRPSSRQISLPASANDDGSPVRQQWMIWIQA
jgi:hypothetical protein